jgi:hypothetical protein
MHAAAVIAALAAPFVLCPAQVAATLRVSHNPSTRSDVVVPIPASSEVINAGTWRALQEKFEECGRFKDEEGDGQCTNPSCSTCDFSFCYARSNAAFGDESECNILAPRVEVCPDLQNPTPQDCPDGLSVEWTVPDEQLLHGEEFIVRSTVKVDTTEFTVQNSTCGTNRKPTSTNPNDNFLIPHVNLHACNNGTTGWWCSTLVPSYQIADITTVEPQCSDVNTHEFRIVIDKTNPVSPNVWMIYVHYVFFTEESDGTLTKRQITRGSSFLVKGEKLEVRRFVVNSMLGISIVLLLFPGLTFLFLIWRFRAHDVIKVSGRSYVFLCIQVY